MHGRGVRAAVREAIVGCAKYRHRGGSEDRLQIAPAGSAEQEAAYRRAHARV